MTEGRINMKESDLMERMAVESIRGWNVISTGAGYLVETDWQWPNRERIEIFIGAVGERKDLFIVSDGGEIFNFFFSYGMDLSKNRSGMRAVEEIVTHYGAHVAEYRIVKGAGPDDLSAAIRAILEALKEISFSLFHLVQSSDSPH